MAKLILIFYVAVLCFATAIGFARYKKMDGATRLLVWYIACTFLTEGTAITMSIFFKQNNLFLYHIYSPLQFLLLTLYFSYSDERKSIYKAGWVIGIAGIILSILNSVYLQPLAELNTNFVVLESFLIIAMSLVAFYRLLISDDIRIFALPRFWFSAIFLVFWSFTFFYWLVGATIYRSLPEKALWLNLMIWLINIAVYSAIAGVFLNYNKMKPREPGNDISSLYTR